MLVLAHAKGRWMYLRAVLGVIDGLVPPDCFLEFHMLWDRQGGFAIALLFEQSISVSTCSCPFQEYINSCVVAGEGSSIIPIKGEPLSIPCLEVSAGHIRIPVWNSCKQSHHCLLCAVAGALYGVFLHCFESVVAIW